MPNTGAALVSSRHENSNRRPQQGATQLLEHLFGDVLISATELNRKPGKVLDRAIRCPVTITRNNESFALLRREIAHRMASAWNDSLILSELVLAILQLREGTLTENPPFGWLRAFSAQELDQLLAEVASVLRKTESLEEVEDEITVSSVVHEWHESAIAMLSEAHAEAYKARGKETPVPLTAPPDAGA